MWYAWLVPGLPLLGTVVNGILGRFLPRRVVGTLACLLVAGSLGISVAVMVNLAKLPAEARHITSVLYPWIVAGDFRADIAILLDPLSALMMVVVSFISLFILIYSTGYMADDDGYPRFFTYVNLFVSSMLILVMANNFLLLFVGWELVGICSYLLIGFWYSKPSAVAAGKKAFLTTRLGDVGFTLGIVMVFIVFGSVDYDAVFGAAGTAAIGALTGICILLFIGAIGKSAQIPLYVWLPDAMEGPTPVSALIHAATMVTAGVYLIARASPLYVNAPGVLTLVAIVGVATAFFAATVALVNNDIKRVLAYSTISQIGYMFLGAGVGAFAAGIFHLMTHAFFKALLFLAAGSVMHALGGETDLRKLGGLRSKLPVTHLTLLAGGLALAGIVPFSGFWSKDEILMSALRSPLGEVLLYAVGALTALLTAFYIFRLIFKTFYGEPRMISDEYHHVHESPISMRIPLWVLAFGATFVGFLGLPAFLARHGEGWVNIVGTWLAPSLAQPASVVAEEPTAGAGVAFMSISLAISAIGILIAWYLYVKQPGRAARAAGRVPKAYNALVNKYYVDEVYNAAILEPGRSLSAAFWKRVDVGIIDFAVNGVAAIVSILSLWFRRVQTGYLRNYALAVFVGAVALVGYFIVRK